MKPVALIHGGLDLLGQHLLELPLLDPLLLLQPGDFVEQIKNTKLPKPLILHVGFRKLYAQAHIPGSDYVGPGGDDDGLKSLSERVEKLPRGSAIVIYCGCCPWERCPNVKPAIAMLQEMGFQKAKVLHLETGFKMDWIDKGYPVE